MTEKQTCAQIKFHTEVKERVRAKGVRMGAVLARANVSATHWHFVGRGKRPLTDDLKNRIEKALNAKY